MNRALPFLLWTALLCPPATAQNEGPAAMVADLLEGAEQGVGTSPAMLTAAGGSLYFVGRAPTAGFEIHRSDGTAEGTRLAFDLCTGRCSVGTPSEDFMAVLGDTLYLSACPDFTACQIFKVEEGEAVPMVEATATHLAVWREALYFITIENELMKLEADGTLTHVQTFRFVPLRLVPARDTLFVDVLELSGIFSPPRPPVQQLWASDGTFEGTRLVHESLGFELLPFTFKGHALLVESQRIWQSDGTAVEPLLTDSPFLSPAPQHATDGVLIVFDASRELWRTDGTPDGTNLIATSPTAVEIESAVYQGELYFVLGRGNRILRRTLELTGATAFFEFPDGVERLEVLGDSLYVALGSPAQALWRSQGTPLTTVSLFDHGEAFDELTLLDGELYFSLAGPRPELGRFTEAGGVEALTHYSAGRSSDPDELARHEDEVVFHTVPLRRFRSDGSAAGTVALADVAATSEIYEVGERAYMMSDQEVFTLDESGELALFFELPGSQIRLVPGVIGPVGNDVLLLTQGTFDTNLWAVDRDSAAPRLVRANLHGLRETFPAPVEFALLGGGAFLLLDETAWWSDGTAAGTRNVLSAQGGPCFCDLENPQRLGGYVYFTNRTSGFEPVWRLRRSDGTAEGTTTVREFPPEERWTLKSGLVAAGGRLFFVAADPQLGEILWASDGTAAGTRPVADLRPGVIDSEHRWLTAYDDRLFFTVDDGRNGRELWTSDGTAEGTSLLRDLYPGGRSSNPQELTVIDGRLVFSADDGVHGLEPWVSDGTASGTRLLQDLFPGHEPSNPRLFTAAGGQVFLNAGRASTGQELWAFPREALIDDLEATIFASGKAIRYKPTVFADVSAGRPDRWCWRFGDEEDGDPECSATTPVARHAYLSAGTYRVSLRVGRFLPSGVEEIDTASLEVIVRELPTLVLP